MSKPFGLDHPTWAEPTCFFYDTANDAWAAIDRAYGPDSEHTVVHALHVLRGADE